MSNEISGVIRFILGEKVSKLQSIPIHVLSFFLQKKLDNRHHSVLSGMHISMMSLLMIEKGS